MWNSNNPRRSRARTRLRFGGGVTISVRGGNRADVAAHVAAALPEAELLANDNLRLEWKIPGSVPLSRLFAAMEAAKQTHGFAEYGITQTTLEQIFVDFARAQVDAQFREEQRRALRELTSA